MPDAPAKIYSDQRTVTICLGDSGDGFTLPFKEKWRAPDAAAAVFGFIVTGALVTANLTSGYALRILIAGAVLTVAAVWLLSKLPATRPTLATRARWCWANTHPRLSCSHRPQQ
jgi:hypothetical protein